MRKSLRTNVAVAFMVLAATLSFAGCKANEPTNVFTSSSVTASVSTTPPTTISNEGLFRYSFNEAAYNELIKELAPTAMSTGTGHAVYSQKDGTLGIISGFEFVALSDRAIPESAYNTLRSEGAVGNRIFVQKGNTTADEESMVAAFGAAKTAGDAVLAQSKTDAYSGKSIIINGRLFNPAAKTDKAVFENGTVYIRAESLATQAGNIRIVESEQGLDIMLESFADPLMKQTLMVSSQDPDTVMDQSSKATFTANADVYVQADGKLYIDPIALASVFDWQVTSYGNITSGEKGVLVITTDPTALNGSAVGSKFCEIMGTEEEAPPMSEDEKIAQEEAQAELDKAIEKQAFIEKKVNEASSKIEADDTRDYTEKEKEDILDKVKEDAEKEWDKIQNPPVTPPEKPVEKPVTPPTEKPVTPKPPTEKPVTPKPPAEKPPVSGGSSSEGSWNGIKPGEDPFGNKPGTPGGGGNWGT